MLQKAICDFGMDNSFGFTTNKLKEHYKIDICPKAIRKITLRHAKRAKKCKKTCTEIFEMIVETDGSMAPIVESNKEAKVEEKIKNYFGKNLNWQQFKKGEVDWLYAVSATSANALGDGLEKISLNCGFGDKTKVHAIGDEALWIYEQMEKIFGCQMTYTIDFFHLCEYLSDAVEGIVKDKKEWMKKKKKL